jgi:hypothetical protein
MAEEVSIYQDPTIQITNLRAMLPGKTYAMANVTSVSLLTQYGNKAPGILVAIFGGFFGLIGLLQSELRGCFVFVAALLVLVGLLYARAVKHVYGFGSEARPEK